jgi:serine/threonine protein kinase/Tol biopolymer transport system component
MRARRHCCHGADVDGRGPRGVTQGGPARPRHIGPRKSRRVEWPPLGGAVVTTPSPRIKSRPRAANRYTPSRLSLSPGQRLGVYDITAQIGEGGMGHVYRATDTKLKRQVAIKILPPSLAADADRLARFQREAEVLASLNHPNIAGIYGLEDGGDLTALVMELVEGHDLSQRIARGAIPLDEALPIVKQIAEALEAAHERGIVHRDLKPANIKVRADGTVKVLDFGLAKAIAPASAVVAETMNSPTFTTPAMTQAGVILGTPAYMSPEQVKGRTADTRADIWAFGVVLFEMLAGRRPFEGHEIADTLASILKSEPAWHALPRDTPGAIQRLLRRCLQKDRHQRLQHMGDARVEIDDAQRAPSAGDAAGPVRSSQRERLVWASAVFVTAVIAAVGWWGHTPEAPEMRVEITTSGSAGSRSFAISPDATQVAFTADGPRGPQLWIRSLDVTAPRALQGTDGGEYPFWSPDGRSIGFFANNKLKRLEIDGGDPQLLANVVTPTGGTWNREGTILYVPRDSGGVYRVQATGGDPSAVTPHRSPELATRVPHFLPDGRHFLFYVAQGGEPAGVYIGDLGSEAMRRILSADGPALFGSDHLWFVREGTLFAQRFNPSTQALSGPVIRVANNVGEGLFAASFSTSVAGAVAYREGAGQPSRQLVWFDRSGKALGTAGEPGGLLANPSLSPNGRYVVVQRTFQANIDLWLLDLQRNVFSRMTDDPRVDSMPVWSPDGERVVFSAAVNDGSSLMVMRIDGTTVNETLSLPATDVKIACDWSADGRYILYRQLEQATGTSDLWALPMSGESTPFQVVRTPSDERDGQFSPDGKWVAYQSDEAGRPEIYLQPFPGPGPKVRVSINGGSQVRWSTNGKEIFYIAPDRRLMAVGIDLAAGAAGVGTPKPLFMTRLAPIRSISRQQYVVAPDGQRFLISSVEEPQMSPITLILNWKDARNGAPNDASR